MAKQAKNGSKKHNRNREACELYRKQNRRETNKELKPHVPRAGISSIEQCYRIQERRVEAQKRGYAKSVIKFLKVQRLEVDMLVDFPVYMGKTPEEVQGMVFRSKLNRAKTKYDKWKVLLAHQA